MIKRGNIHPTISEKKINVVGSIRLELSNDDDYDLKTIQPLIATALNMHIRMHIQPT